MPQSYRSIASIARRHDASCAILSCLLLSLSLVTALESVAPTVTPAVQPLTTAPGASSTLAHPNVDGRIDLPDLPSKHIRFYNDRVGKIVRFAMQRSAAFQGVVAALEVSDRIVYIMEGSCRHQLVSGCLQVMPIPGGKYLSIRIRPRQLIKVSAAQLAHELYHASEIAREPDVVDAGSVRALYRRIGERSCAAESDDCWETRAAAAFETLVTEELNGVRPRSRSRHHPAALLDGASRWNRVPR